MASVLRARLGSTRGRRGGPGERDAGTTRPGRQRPAAQHDAIAHGFLAIRVLGASLALVVGLLAAAATAAGAPPPLSLTAPPAFSPNGDGVKDILRLTLELASPAVVTAVVRAPDGSETATLAHELAFAGGATTLQWDGRTLEDVVAPDGIYQIVVTGLAEGGESLSAEATARLDTKAPTLRWISMPAGIGAGPLVTRFRLTDASGEAVVTLLAGEPGERRSPSGNRELEVGTQRVAWQLRAPGGARRLPGAYRVSLQAVDQAGNRGSSSARPLLVTYAVSTRVIRRVDGAGRRVALTFDDCNDGAAWARILAVLSARGASATFFCLGSQIARHADQARRTLRDGHAIGNHSWNHPLLTRLTTVEVRSDTERATGAWWRLARVAPMPFYRPPYGAYDGDSLAGIGAAGFRDVILWDVDPQDWRRPGAGAIAARATGPARSGSIILLHALPQTADALPAILDGLRARGLRSVTLTELLAGRNG